MNDQHRKLESPNFTQIPNAIFDHWIPKLKPTATIVLVILCRKIFGWHKTSDAISANQLIKCTGLSKPTLIAALKELESHELITKIQTTDERGCRPNEFKLKINVPIDTIYTEEIIESDAPVKNIDGGSQKSLPGVVKNLDWGVVKNLYPQKKDSTKERLTKENMSEPAVGLTDFFFQKLKEINPKIKEPNFIKWTQEMHRLLNTDKRSEEEVRKVIEFLVHDDKNPKGDFTWSQAVQSPEKLRKHYAAIWKQMNKTAAPKSEKKKQEEKFQESEEQRTRISENRRWFDHTVIPKLFQKAMGLGVRFYSDAEKADINGEDGINKKFLFKDPDFKDLVKKEINRRKLI